MTFAERRRLELDYKEWLKRESIASGVAVEDCALTVIGYLDSKGLINKIPKWIPVSERLPENSGVYIVSKWVSDGVESAILTDANYYDGCGEWYNDNRINWGRDLVTNDILAWMPIPEPYKGGK